MSEAKVLTKRQLSSIVRKITRHKEAIGKHRDALRDIVSDLTGIIDTADDAYQSLDYALDQLSQYL